jgi:hypothetical protein
MTILDSMVFVAGFAISALLLRGTTPEFWLQIEFPPRGLFGWSVAGFLLLYGPIVIGPALVLFQCLRGRKLALQSGELIWCILAILYSVPCLMVLTNAYEDGSVFFEFYRFAMWSFSPLEFGWSAMFAIAALVVQDRPRTWSHRVGSGLALAQAALILIQWSPYFYTSSKRGAFENDSTSKVRRCDCPLLVGSVVLC